MIMDLKVFHVGCCGAEKVVKFEWMCIIMMI